MTLDPNTLLQGFNPEFQSFLQQAYPADQSGLNNAVRYCLGGDGKKVRAVLSLMVCESYGVDSRLAFAAATAVEMIHAYSLAHDDLPCMDNDDFRRGRPSLHKAFDEATALLAGDAVLTDAFRVLSDDGFSTFLSGVAPGDRIRLVRELARAAGGGGMVAGQALDMHWTGKGGYTNSDLNAVHAGKTGALIGAAAAMGAISAGASEGDAERWREFGVLIGVAFQAVDDTIDQSQATGKSAGKDLKQGKLTFLRFHSREETLKMAVDITESALARIPKSPGSAQIETFARALVFRQK